MASGNLDNKGKGKGKAVVNHDIPAPPPAPMTARVIHRPESQSQQPDKRRLLIIKSLMHKCVLAMEAGNTHASNSTLVELSSFAHHDGDPIQRLTSAFTEALAHRALKQLQGLSWSMQEQLRWPPSPGYAEVSRQWFHGLSPLLQAAALPANHAIVKAVEGEQDVHVVDLGGANPKQWIDLLRLLAARPGGAPSLLRLSIVSEHAFFLSCTTKLLTAEAASLRFPLVLNPVRAHIDNFSATVIAALGVQPGQSLVMSSTLQLHRLIADTTIVWHSEREHQTVTRADALLHVLRDLSPKLLVLTEQEADHNGGEGRGLWGRVNSAFDYYAVLFNDMEASGSPRESRERKVVEQMVFREEIVDIVAHDGAARRERHEKMARWAQRMMAAGFQTAPVHMDGFKETTRLEKRGMPDADDGDRQNPLYRVAKEKDQGCFFVSSSWTPMFTVSLWEPAPRGDA